MSKIELKNYSTWLQEIFPARIIELEKTVQHTSGFEKWHADFTPNSLNKLGDWFENQVETRSRTQDEIEEIKTKPTIPIEIPTTELTNRTFSLAIDIGIYFGQTLLIENPKLQWTQKLNNKRDIDYGQLVLIGKGPIPCNPIHLLITLAYGITSKQKKGRDIFKLYEIWTKITGT